MCSLNDLKVAMHVYNFKKNAKLFIFFTDIIVEFSNANLSVLASNRSLVVTLVTPVNTLSQSFIIGVIAEADNSSESPAIGMYCSVCCLSNKRNL